MEGHANGYCINNTCACFPSVSLAEVPSLRF